MALGLWLFYPVVPGNLQGQAGEYAIDLRTAAFVLAIHRVGKQTRRGCNKRRDSVMKTANWNQMVSGFALVTLI